MSELWADILKDDEPMEPAWKDVPMFFTMKGNGSFCDASDELGGKRRKTTHV